MNKTLKKGAIFAGLAGLGYLLLRKKGQTILGAGASTMKTLAYVSDKPRSVIILPPPLAKGGGPSVNIENPVRVTVYGASPQDYLGSWKFAKPASVVVQYIDKGQVVKKTFNAPKGVEEVYINADAMPSRVY